MSTGLSQNVIKEGVSFPKTGNLAGKPTQFNYNSGISHLLSIILQKQTGVRLDSFTAREIFSPLGISDYYWSHNQDEAARGYSGLYLKPRDLAKFGLLYLNS